MKKEIGLLCGVLVFSNVCWGVTIACSGGTVVTAKSGVKLCRSNLPMTWYAAQAWCASNNSKLVSVKTACNGSDNYDTSKCSANVKGLNALPNDGNISKRKWAFVNRADTGNNPKVYRVNIATGGTPSATNPINRPVGDAKTGETTSTYGPITDMVALCEPKNSSDTYLEE